MLGMSKWMVKQMSEIFVADVLSRLPKIEDEQDFAVVKKMIPTFYERGWTVTETVKFFLCMQEVNPFLNEEVALTRMSEIEARVKMRQNAEGKDESNG